jgi:hypothetical protein
MTNLQAMQDEQLLELIRDVEKLGKLYTNLVIPSWEGENLLEERICLQRLLTERWRELMEEEND